MSHLKEENNKVSRFFKGLYLFFIPNKRDNFKQIFFKLLFIISLATLVVSSGYLISYFASARQQDSVLEESREIWNSTDNDATDESGSSNQSAKETLISENSDFMGWITINGTQIDNPIYQTDNNDFYINHNQNKEVSKFGALFFDYRNTITEAATDKNLVIYGHEMKNGSMFGELKKLKSLDFYKQQPTLEFSTLYSKATYKIYAIFILNAKKADDDNYIYNIYKNNFSSESEFDFWTAEAYERSIINTNVDVSLGDNIVTLVTCSSAFEDARLIVMARQVREGESASVDTSLATVNPNPRYPKLWYDERGLKYPYADE